MVAYTSEQIVKVTKSKEKGLSKIAAKNNHIANNMFVDFRERMDLSLTANTVENNLFVFNTKLGNLEIKKWQAKLISKQGQIMRADVSFNSQTLMLKWSSLRGVQPIPTRKEVNMDFAKEKRSTTTIQGPFKTLLPNCDYFVSLKKH